MLKKRIAALTVAGASVLGLTAAASPASAHGSLVNIEVEDNQVAILNGITVGLAANVCGVDVDVIQVLVLDLGQDVDCKALTEQTGQHTVITND